MGSPPSAEFLNRDALPRPAIERPHIKWTRITVHAASLVEDRVLIGVICRSRFYEFGDQRCLAAATFSRNDECALPPAHNTRMYEDAMALKKLLAAD